MRAAVIVLLLASLQPALLFAQSTSSDQSTQPSGGGSQTPSTTQPGSSGPSTSASQPPQSGTPQPVPYSPDEFPLWLRQLRRAEIITIGAFPIALLVSSLGYQTVRYAQHGYSQDYAPSLFGNAATPLTDKEKIGILLGGAGLSIAVALADFIVGKLTRPPDGGKQP